MKKLFIFNNKNKYYKYILHFYNIYQEQNSQQSTICDFRNLEQKNFKDIDVIITNITNHALFIKNKSKIFFLINKFSENKKFNFFDFHLDPYLKVKSPNNFENNFINFNENYIKDTFDIIKKLEWDTEFWRKKTATLYVPKINNKILKKVSTFIKKNKIQFCSYLCLSNHSESVQLAENFKFKFTDIRLTYEKKISSLKRKRVQNNYLFHMANKSDIKILRQLVDNIYVSSRYYYDKNFSHKRVNLYYKDWIRKSVLGLFDDYCLILKKKNIKTILGFVTIKINNDNSANIGLIGINKKYQGMGFGSTLFDNLVNHLIMKKIKKIYVITQGRNIRAQRLYQQNGFVIKSSEIWYHKWID